MNDKLYIITRADLEPGAQAAQSCHALRAFAAAYPDEEKRWYATSNNLVLLAAKDEAQLRGIVAKMVGLSIPVACFREPDFSDQLTAIAIAPDGGRHLSTLPLALRTRHIEAAQRINRRLRWLVERTRRLGLAARRGYASSTSSQLSPCFHSATASSSKSFML